MQRRGYNYLPDTSVLIKEGSRLDSADIEKWKRRILQTHPKMNLLHVSIISVYITLIGKIYEVCTLEAKLYEFFE